VPPIQDSIVEEPDSVKTRLTKKGLFLSFQYPQEISGVTLSNFLRTALNAKRSEPISVPDFHKLFRNNYRWFSLVPTPVFADLRKRDNRHFGTASYIGHTDYVLISYKPDDISQNT